MEPPTLEELVKKVRISVDLLDQPCSDEHLKSISLFLDWRNIAPHLGLSEIDIEDIISEERKESDRRRKALLKWKTKYSYKATLKSLVEALMRVGNADNAEKVCRLLKSQAGKPSASAATATALDTSGDFQQKRSVTAEEPSHFCSAVADTPQLPVQHSEKNIENEVQELEDQFFNVVEKASEHLRTVELPRIKLCVTQLPVSVKYQHIKFLDCKADSINDAKSIDAVFTILGRYWNFLNCGLLCEIVRKLGNETTKQLMKMYTDNLSQFRKNTKLGDFVDKRACSIPPHFSELITRMKGDWRDRTLEELEEFRKELALSLHMEEYAMYFTKAETGSVALTWALPSSLPAITDSLQHAFQLLEKKYSILGVIFLKKCIPNPKSLESPPSATPLAPLSPPTPLEESEQENFDMVEALLSAGVPHIPQQILKCLDVKSLARSEQVSVLWRDTVSYLSIWKHLMKNNTDSNKLWQALFKRRGWSKYLDDSLSKKMSSRFYRHLYQSASRDIHFLETNWRRGHYTLTKIETGSYVLCLQYDDNKIVTGHSDHTIKIWDRSTLKVSKVLEGHKDSVLCLQYSKEVVISGSADHTVKVWDTQMGQMVNKLLHHKDWVWSLKFTTKTLVTGSSDKTVAVWEIISPTVITLRAVLKGHAWDVYAVELNESNIISGSLDDTIKVWDSFSGGLVRTLHGHSEAVRSLQLRGSHLISVSDDKTIRIWNIDSGECVRVLHGHDDRIKCVATDDKRILSGSHDKTVKVWDLAAALDPGSSSDDLCISTLKKHTDWVQAVSFDHFQVISGSSDKSVIVYDFLPPIHRS